MAISNITFYSKKNCSQCSTTARVMASNGLAGVEGTGININPKTLEGKAPVTVVKVDEDTKAFDQLKERGYGSVPVVDYHMTDGTVTTIVGADVEQIAAVAKEGV